MRFILIRKHPWGEIKDRVIAPIVLEPEAKGSPDEQLFVCAMVKVTEDFKEDGLTVLTSDTDSIQIRPKQLFKNTKGYYYKLGSSRVYVRTSDVEEFLFDISKKEVMINEKLKQNPKAQSYGIN